MTGRTDSSERVNLRCSAVVFREERVLLVQRATDWVLPGGTPRSGESVASCARREVAEETGLQIHPRKVAFLLETSNRDAGEHLLDVVFLADEMGRPGEPQTVEDGLQPRFCALDDLTGMRLRPPLAGYLRALHARGDAGVGLYLGNLWRPDPDLDTNLLGDRR